MIKKIYYVMRLYGLASFMLGGSLSYLFTHYVEVISDPYSEDRKWFLLFTVQFICAIAIIVSVYFKNKSDKIRNGKKCVGYLKSCIDKAYLIEKINLKSKKTPITLSDRVDYNFNRISIIDNLILINLMMKFEKDLDFLQEEKDRYVDISEHEIFRDRIIEVIAFFKIKLKEGGLWI